MYPYLVQYKVAEHASPKKAKKTEYIYSAITVLRDDDDDGDDDNYSMCMYNYGSFA